MTPLGPRKVAQIQEAPKGIKVKLLENMTVNNVTRRPGEELELFASMERAEYLASQGILLIIDAAWEKAVIVETEK
jgi:hypothetical protein